MSLRKNAPEGQPPVARASDDPGAPMTADQTAYLRELWRRAGDSDAFDETLTMGEAQKRIAALEIRLEREQHSGKVRLPRT